MSRFNAVEHASDLPHATLNRSAREAAGYANFVEAILSDLAHIEAHGLTRIEPGEGNDSKNQLQCYSTDIKPSMLARRVERIFTLARLGSKVNVEDLPTIEAAMRAAVSALRTLDIDLWRKFEQEGAQILSGPEAAQVETDGYAHSESRKGHSTVIRYDETALHYAKQHKSAHPYMHATAYLSERDMRA
jgi:hypothetical protein